MSESSSRIVRFFDEQERLSGQRRTYYALRTENMLTEPYYVRHTPELAEMADVIFRAHFRLHNYNDFRYVAHRLEIPAVMTCSNGTRVTGEVAFAIVLRRMAYPSRWIDLADLLGRDVTQLSRIYNAMVDWLYSKHCHRLESLDQPWLAREDVERYARAVYRRGGRYDNCWAFVDGTARPICRPGADQRDYYSGHCRLHVLKWQSIVAPDGLIVNLWGPAEGRRHDCFMLAQSNLIARLRAKNEEWGKLYCVFGDRGYSISDVVQRSFKGKDLTEEEKKFNEDMASCRIVVESGFGKINQYFAFGNYQQNNKLFLQQVATSYIVSAFLTNCHTCVYGFGIAKSIFNIDPPHLERYLDKN